MNPVQKHIQTHRSIRKYKSDPIPEDVLARILNAAVRASSSGNMQAYSIILTKGKDLKQKLLPAHFQQQMITEAPVLMTFCADFNRMRRWLNLSDAPENFDNFMSFMIATVDAVLASQNAALAAESEGLGICYLGTTLASCGEIAQILKCPSHVVPVVGFTIGYPAEAPKVRDRLPLKGLVHHEVYRDPTDGEILEIYKQREVDGWNRYLSHPELKNLIETSGVKNLAQVYTQLKYTKESHIQYSEMVLSCLTEKGFI